LHVSLTGESDGYYADYADAPVARVAHCLTEGFDYQGQASAFREGAQRGEVSRDLPPTCFVSFLQNHDQIGNRAFGERISKLAAEPALKAAMAIVLLAPSPPLLFMGEEFAADTPFLFFCDFGGDLASAVTNGRRNEFSRFARFSDPAFRAQIPDPNARETFLESKLDWSSTTKPVHKAWTEFYRTLLALRKEHVVPRISDIMPGRSAVSMLSGRAFVASWALSQGGSLLLAANMSDQSLRHDTLLAGKLLYSTHESAAEQLNRELPSWSAAWFLTE
jgi:maltooligosyltrehalose trehalohydrolase